MVGTAVALFPMVASAHAQPVASNPAPGAVLDKLPAGVEIFFSEAVTPAGRGISVYGPDGRLVSSGPAKAEGRQLAVGVTGASEGTYAVIWTVIATDTHPSRGSFTFSVGHVSPVIAPGIGSGDVGLVSPVGLVLQALGRWLHFAGFALAFGAATYSLFVARNPLPQRLAGAGIALLIAAEPLSLLAQTTSIDPAQAFDVDSLTSALASPFGRVLGLHLAAALLVWAVLGALRQAPWLRWGVPALGVALSVVDATAAHATGALPQPMGLLLNALHVSAMGIWVGGVAAFALSPSAGFGRIAVWSAGLLLLSGAALALLHFGRLHELISTVYGITLLIKLALVAVALYMARLGRRRWELAALMLVVAAASAVVSLPPPR
jgi:copper transport protein